MLNLVLDYRNQGWWGISVFLKKCNFEHIKLPISFNCSMMNVQSLKKQRTQIC